MGKRRIGVLVMSYGTPESMEQVESYYTHIRRGHPPTPELLKELQDRYEAIGGLFPLRENTNKQVQALEGELNRRYPDIEFKCFQGLKHASPFIEDGVARMAAEGFREAVGIVLAPHYSAMSVGSYIKRAEAEAVRHEGLAMRFVESYHLHPQLIAVLSERLNEALSRFPADERDQVRVLFTAHSLPASILETGDPYPEQLLATSRAVADRSGVSNWQFGWQSAGRTATPWLGPDILNILRNIREDEGVRHALVCPVGFVSDHLEVLYDIDIEAKAVARELDLHLERTESLNTDPGFIAVLADAVAEQLA